jgi:hypothetical protein
MKTFLAPIMLGAALLLAGCEEKTPSDRLSAESIRPIAEREALEGLVVDEFKKENGWQDTAAINTYVVRYNYKLKLVKPLPEVALGLSNAILSAYADAQNNPGMMGINLWKADLDLSQEASEWILPQGEGFVARRDAFFASCQACIDRWNQEGKKEEVNARRQALIVAWSRLEAMGFKDADKIGAKVPRQAWSSFMKTEQGWMLKQG